MPVSRRGLLKGLGLSPLALVGAKAVAKDMSAASEVAKTLDASFLDGWAEISTPASDNVMQIACSASVSEPTFVPKADLDHLLRAGLRELSNVDVKPRLIR